VISSVLPNFVSIDTETTGLNPWKGHKVFAVNATFPSGRQLYWRDDFNQLSGLLADSSIDKVFQNAKFDCRMLERKGFPVKGRIWDTMIFAHLLNGRQALKLEALAKRYLPGDQKIVTEIDDWFKAHKIKKDERGEHFADLPPELLKKRCQVDSTITAKLFIRLYKPVVETFPRLLEQEHRLLPIVSKMEDRGLLIDIDEAREQQIYLDEVVEHVQQFCAGIMDDDFFNLNSDDQCRTLLLKTGILHRIRSRTKKTRKHQINGDNLRRLHHPVAAMLCLGRQASYLRGNFIQQMLDHNVNGTIHPGWNPLGTVTGRFSSSKPNLLNMPEEGGHLTEEEMREQIDLTGIDLAPHIKRIFKVREGYIHIHADKEKVEIAMLAHYTKDPVLIEILNSGHDVHTEICIKMFGKEEKHLRVRAKAVVFGYIYGAGDDVIADNVQCSPTEAHEYRKRLEQICPNLPMWKARLHEQIKDRGYVITEHGRRHYLYPNESYMSVNRMCQGTAADEVKSRMVAIGEWFASEYPDATILLNLHDDIPSEIPIEDAPHIIPIYKALMEKVSMDFQVPLPVSISLAYGRWSDLKEYEWDKLKEDLAYEQWFESYTKGPTKS
jgi:DNA polymerase-1